MEGGAVVCCYAGEDMVGDHTSDRHWIVFCRWAISLFLGSEHTQPHPCTSQWHPMHHPSSKHHAYINQPCPYHPHTIKQIHRIISECESPDAPQKQNITSNLMHSKHYIHIWTLVDHQDIGW
eukprot:762128_1